MIHQAEKFARAAHSGHTRKGDSPLPYAVHLEEVVDFVTRHGGDPETIAAAWLHDTVEDTGVTLEEIERRFGSTVAGLVKELTDDKSLPKPERKRRQVASAPTKSARAALIKVGDKTSNVRALRLTPPGWEEARIQAYADWASEVVSALPPVPEPALAEFAEALALVRNGADQTSSRQ